MQKAIKQAVRQARLTKRVTSTPSGTALPAISCTNYDIRTIQELSGHSSVKTTMIYTHTVKSQPRKKTMSPLDF